MKLWNRLILGLDKYSASLSKILAVIGGIFCFLAVFFTVAEVVARDAFSFSIQGIMTGMAVIAPLMFALGTSQVQVDHSHIRVTMFVDRLGLKTKLIVEIASLVISTLMLALLAWLVTGDAIASWQRGQYESGIVRIPIYPAKVLISLSIALLGLRNLVDILILAFIKSNKKEFTNAS
jgi:TRAP-type transport system small permease protein